MNSEPQRGERGVVVLPGVVARQINFFSRRNKDLVGHGSVQDGNIAAWWQGHAMFTEITSGFNDRRRPLLVCLVRRALTALLSLVFQPSFWHPHDTLVLVESGLLFLLFQAAKRSSPLFLGEI